MQVIIVEKKIILRLYVYDIMHMILSCRKYAVLFVKFGLKNLYRYSIDS